MQGRNDQSEESIGIEGIINREESLKTVTDHENWSHQLIDDSKEKLV